MGDHLKGKVAIVTGSGQGVGRAVAIAFAKEGAKVITNNRTPIKDKPLADGDNLNMDDYAKLSEERKKWFKKVHDENTGDAETTAATIKEMGGEATACFADIAKWDDAKKLVDFAVETYGRIDIVCNIAGSFGFSPFEQMTEEMWDRVTGVKPKGYFNVMRHAVPYMLEQGDGGRIINTTSRAMMGDVFKHAEYCAANAGVVGLTRAVAIEFHDKGITCNAFGPFARTRASYELDATDETKDFETSVIPLAVPKYEDTPGPELFTPFLVWLASDASEKVTGSVFSLAGNTIQWHNEPTVRTTITKPDPWTVDEVFDAMPRNLLMGYESILKQYGME
ncbi:MAG: SDR family NAD(P)-dependent oxidoreductase [Coriobacteriales bacterium]|jgi:3-oxoacyl-[acyl-carrier protein] reductase